MERKSSLDCVCFGGGGVEMKLGRGEQAEAKWGGGNYHSRLIASNQGGGILERKHNM